MTREQSWFLSFEGFVWRPDRRVALLRRRITGQSESGGSGRFRMCLKSHGSGPVGSGGGQTLTGWVGFGSGLKSHESGQAILKIQAGRVGSANITGRVGSPGFQNVRGLGRVNKSGKNRRSSRVSAPDPTRPDPT